MKATDDLRSEHQAVRVSLKILDAVCSELDRKDRTAKAGHPAQLLEFFTTFVDRCHHGKEEELLFPALEKAGVPREGGPIGVMLAEHERGREYVKAMRRAMPGDGPWADDDIAAFVAAARGYIELLMQHTDKEDNILFVMADQRLPIQEQEALVQGYDKIETQRIGEGKHEAFHRMLEELEGVYLK